MASRTPTTTPASLIDVLHRLCVFREKNDTEGMAEFLGRSGQGRNPNLWLVAQAVSEILPDGDKEKRISIHARSYEYLVFSMKTPENPGKSGA